MNSRHCDSSMRVILLVLTVLATSGTAEEDLGSPPALSTDAIVQRLMAANARRAEALRGYRGQRVYHLDYHGLFGSHNAEMQVEASYIAPDRKSFRVISHSGSKLLLNRVLLKLLNSEQEAQQEQNREELELTSRNYDFAFAGTQRTPGGDFYIVDVKPKGKSKYLYNGKIWVDAHEFAVARMEGEPAKNPSFWVSHTHIEYRWGKFGAFWLPVHNESVTQVRMGGKAVLTIDYTDYQITATNRATRPGSQGNPTLPDPSSVTADPH